MVSGSSISPLHLVFQHSTSPYEPEFVATAAPCPTSPHPRARDRVAPTSPQRTSVIHAVVPLAASDCYERAVSPLPSTVSAPGAGETPMNERLALGRFSASSPAFQVQAMSPLDPSADPRGHNDAVLYAPRSPFEHPNSLQELTVVVHPDDNQIAAASHVEFSAAPTPAEDAPPSAAEAAAQGEQTSPSSMPPPPLLLMLSSSSQQQQQPNSFGTPTRSRLGNMLFGPTSPTALPDSAPAMGTSLCDHISRTTSLPLMMGGAVVPQGVSPAIPIAIAGVGACGRARATTVHAPTPTGAGMGVSTGGAGAGSTFCPVAQSVDHSFYPAPPQQPQLQPQSQAQLQFLNSSEVGALVNSPAQFIGSFSPGAPVFYAPPAGPAAATTTATGVGPEGPTLQVPSGNAADDMVLSSPGGGGAAVPVSAGTAAKAPQGAGRGPSARRSCGEGSPTRAQVQHDLSKPPLNLDSRHPGALEGAEAGKRIAGSEGVEGEDEGEGEEDMMDGASSLTGSSCGRRGLHPYLQQQQQRGLQGRGGAAAPAHADLPLQRRDTTDTDGDEEFEDAVEVQHDDGDHVDFHGQRREQGGGGGGSGYVVRGFSGGTGGVAGVGYQPHGHSHDLARCHFVGEASPERPFNAIGISALHHPALGMAQQEPQYPHQHQLQVGVVHQGGAAGQSMGAYRLGGEYEELAEDDELLGEEEDGSCLLDGEEEGLDDDEEVGLADEDEEEEEIIAPRQSAGGGGGPGWGSGAVSASPAHFISPYTSQQNMCINCTRPFWGAVCYCGQPANTEVVDPELLAAAVRSMEEGQAAASTRAHQQAGQAQRDGCRGKGVLLAYDDRCRAHLEELTPGSSEDQGRSHPERPERVAAIMARLQATGLLARFERVTGREASFQELVAVHQPELVTELQAATDAAARLAAREAARNAGTTPPEDDGEMDLEALGLQKSPHILDCYFNASTAACARLAAGSAADVARRVVSGSARHGAAIIRPPGHHAESGVAMGFCYYNNAAVAARAAQAAGARRVLIMDWDVHHGNGTQRIFYDDPSVLYMSTHRFDHGTFYPGTGDATETGSGAGVGFTVNVPWNGSGVRDADMLAAFRHVLLPLAAEFRPDLVIISAGFDAVEGDPLGGCRVSPSAFGHFTALLSSLAPTVMLLEGGYNLTATAAATEACLRVLLGEQPMPLPGMGAVAGGAAAAGVDASASGGASADPWVAASLEGVSDSAIESLRLVLRVQSQLWQAARERRAALEAALEERRQRQMMRMQPQLSPPQPQEHWGWHVQMPSGPSSQPQQHVHVHVAETAVDSDDHCQSRLQLQHVLGDEPNGRGSFPGEDMDEQALEQEQERRRRMDVSMSGVMDLGDQLLGDAPMA